MLPPLCTPATPGAKETILIVDDERHAQRLLRLNLEPLGYSVITSARAAGVLELVHAHQPDVIVLDLRLSDGNGLDLCRRIRSESVVPIIIMSAYAHPDDKLRGLEAGADDYLAKPFHMEELLARIRALLRRAAGHATSELAAGPVRLDTRSGRVSVNGTAVKLTSHEYRLLSYLMHHAGRIVSRGELTEHLYDQDFDRDSNTIEVFVGRLRKKLGVYVIQTVRGLGYLVDSKAEGDQRRA